MAGPDAYGPPAASPDVAFSSAPVVPGRLLGARYELVRPIARGGMAEVWEGQDATLRRAVAIKVLQTHLAGDITFVERFRREAVSAARVAHPCVVATYDAGVDAGTAFIVMELVRGQTLRQLLTASAPLAPGLAVAIAQQIADALADAHRAGLVHRDIKPANILLCDDGAGALRVKVTDFGIAKVGAEIGADLTQIGTVLGTPKYLSPEQLEGRVEPDARSDLYALGVVLFEMLTGRPPFNGPTAMATALAHLREPPPPVSSLRPEISAGLDDLVQRLLAKAPADRPPTAVAVRLMLDSLVQRGLVEGPGLRPSAVESRAARGSGADGGGAHGGGSDGLRTAALGGAVGNERWRRRSAPGATPRGAVRLGGEPGPATEVIATDAIGAGRRPSSGRPPVPSPPGPSGGRRREEPRPGVAGSIRSGPAPRRRGRLPGLVVAAIVLAAVIVTAILIADHGGAGHPGASTPGSTAGGKAAASSAAASIRPQAVTVWMNTTAHTPDNPGQAGAVIDGQASTMWETDTYTGAHADVFGGLYSGEGLAIHLTGSQALHRLVVQSPTQGWAASTYVAETQPPGGSPVSAWGTPTATQADIHGDATFSLGGRKGAWVLLWLTNLGPAARAAIAEITIS